MNSLVKGIEIVLLSSGEKEEEEAMRFAFIQAEVVLITSTLLTVLSIFRLFMNGGEEGFIFYLLSFFVTIILLFLSGRFLRRTAITQGFDFVKKRKHLISVGFQNRSAKDIMTPRISIVSLDKTMKSRDVIAKAIECGFSRLPVYDGSPDNVAGFLYVKDLIVHLTDKEYHFDRHSQIREA